MGSQRALLPWRNLPRAGVTACSPSQEMPESLGEESFACCKAAPADLTLSFGFCFLQFVTRCGLCHLGEPSGCRPGLGGGSAGLPQGVREGAVPPFTKQWLPFPTGRRSAVGSCALVQLFSFLREGHPGHGRLGAVC